MTNFNASARLAELIRHCVRSLPDDDRAARIEYCQVTGEHGVRVAHDGEDLVLTWGGHKLAVIPSADLLDPTTELASEYVSPAPHDLSGLDSI